MTRKFKVMLFYIVIIHKPKVTMDELCSLRIWGIPRAT